MDSSLYNAPMHNMWHTVVKKELKASFVAFERCGDQYSLRVICDGKPVSYPFEGTPADVSVQNYLNLIKALKNEKQA